jgi:hypothetical protein
LDNALGKGTNLKIAGEKHFEEGTFLKTPIDEVQRIEDEEDIYIDPDEQEILSEQ